MNCPRCQAALVAETHENMEFDRCPTCSGLWLDKGEDEAATRPDLPQGLMDRVASLDSFAGVDDSPPLTCPRCSTTMRREHYASSLVEIDRCDCGVWLDTGELEKIVAYRTRCLERLSAGSEDESQGVESGLDFTFSPDVLERSFAKLYFRLGRSE